MSKNKSQKSGNAAKKEKTNEEHLAARMKDISKILKLNEEGLDYMAIASKVRVGVTYVEEVIAKGAAEMEVQLRDGYGITPTNITSETNIVDDPGANVETPVETTDNSPIEAITETKAEKAKKSEEKTAKTLSEPKAPKESRTREKALLQALAESNGTGLTLEAIGTRANEILSINRKSWTGTLGAMKRANEISYNKETKLYIVV